jgi:hypothetical protein
MKRNSPAAVLLILSACARERPRTDAMDGNEVSRVTTEIARAVASPARRAGCGRPAARQPRGVTFVNTRQALSCRDLGFALRRIERRDSTGGAIVAVPAGDTAEVCRFLRTERVAAPVLLMADPDGRLSGVRTLVSAVLDQNAEVARTYTAQTGVDLISRISARVITKPSSSPKPLTNGES